MAEIRAELAEDWSDPDKNPTEHAPKEAEDSTSNRRRATFEEASTAFEAFITSNKFPCRLTRKSC